MMTRPVSRRASARTSMRVPPSALVIDPHLLQGPADPPVGLESVSWYLHEPRHGGDEIRPAIPERPDLLFAADAQDVRPRDAATQEGDQAGGRVAAGDDLIRGPAWLLVR